MRRSLIAPIVVALALAVSGCGGDDDEEKADTAAARTTTAQEDTRSTSKAPPPKEREAARREAADRKEQEREQREEDRELDESFKQDRFERLVGRLPIRKPPLYVEQYITGDGHKVYTAVARGRFCKLSAAKREAAVRSFFETADRMFRRGGVTDFEQVVTPLMETLDKLPALATARRGSVELTDRGRRC